MSLSIDIIHRADSTAYKLGDLVAPDPPAPFAVTFANMKLSLVNGAAFIDVGVAGALTPYVGSKITITDSTGKKAVGYINAAGTGETYGSNLVTNGGFDSDASGWSGTYATLASISGGDSGNCLEITRTEQVWQDARQYVTPIVLGALYQLGVKVKSGTSGNEASRLYGYSGSTAFYLSARTTTSSWESLVGKITLSGSTARIRLVKNTATAGTMLFDTATFQQILTPSATGVTIASSQGGSPQNWASIDTEFNYNDSSGYTVTIDRGGHIYKCTTPGTSASSQPSFDTTSGSTTTDGTVVWTECNPTGTYYTGPITFQTDPKYGDNVHIKQYAQPIDYSVGGDVYSYDKSGGVPRQRREITFQRMLSTDLALLLDFLELIVGAKHNFLFTDESALVHTAKLLNPDEIRSTPTDYGYESDIRLELFLYD